MNIDSLRSLSEREKRDHRTMAQGYTGRAK